MNVWDYEKTAEYHQQRTVADIEHIRLERLAMKSQPYHPRFFARTMFTFANWMISTGKELRKRYEIPAVNGSNPSTESFAH